ncbi:MAG: TonB-dependent receptor [Longimicrobiales bacterium]
MTRRLVLFTFLLGLMLTGPAMVTAAEAEAATDSILEPARILGTVTASGAAVGYADVVLRGYGIRATADSRGRFVLGGVEPGSHTILVSSLGYGTAEVTVEVGPGATAEVEVALEEEAIGLNPIVVTATRKRTFVSESPVKVDVVPARFLQNMATSSLTESIQHVNGLYQQVDCAVCYTNNIRINGMEGPYTSVLIDGQPIMSSLASVYGLNGINPSLIERIEIIKGPSSTLYGSDAMAGVINVITKDPRFAPRLSVDARQTDHGATSVDFAVAPSVGSTRGLVSGTFYRQGEFLDDNGDGYADVTLDTRLSLFGKVHLEAERGGGLSLAGKYYHEDRFGGERGWTKEDRGSDEVYGESIYTDRFELLGAWGLPVPAEDLKLEFSLTHHRQDAMYATSPYNADQNVVAGHLLWEPDLGRGHDVLLGVGGEWESFDDESPATVEPVTHVTPGFFAQDEYTAGRGVKLLGGLRVDHHGDHGVILSPRAALKLEPLPATAVRLNAGTGFRVVDLFTEDYASLTHTRRLVTAQDLDPERSYNLTLNVNQVVDWGNNPMMLDVDAFYTHFTNRIIPDYDSDPGQIIYHNLDGFGVTRGVGVSLNQNMTVLPLFYTLGITVQDVFYEHEGARERELFAASFKGVWSATYTTPWDVAVDYTGTVVGPMRLPAYDEPFSRPTSSETYAVHNLMVTWDAGDDVEVYAGARNLFDYTQPSPIVDPANPFGENFDTAWVYGPIYGRNLVVGGRYSLGR